MRMSDLSSDVCSSYLIKRHGHEFHKLAVDHITSRPIGEVVHHLFICELWLNIYQSSPMATSRCASLGRITGAIEPRLPLDLRWRDQGYEPAKQPVQGNSRGRPVRSEEHTSELQSLMRISYAVFCLKKKKTNQT